jgi:prevent-host-death family protein
MQVNMLEAKTQLSKLVEAALRGEEVVIANRGKPVVRLVKAEAPMKRKWGAWEGLMTEEELDHAFSPEVEAEMAREWITSLERPLEAGLKPRRRQPAKKKTAPVKSRRK